MVFAEECVARAVLEEGATVARGLVYGRDLVVRFFPSVGTVNIIGAALN